MADDNALYYSIGRVVPLVVPPIFGLTALLGSVGNILVIIVVLCNKTMRNTPNILILNLAATDLIFLACDIPFTGMRYVLDRWPAGVVLCKVVSYVRHAALFGSTYTLVLLAISRYLAMVHSIKALVICTPKHTYIAICVMWASILSVSTYYICAYSIYEYPPGVQNFSVCTDLYILDNNTKDQIYTLCYVLLGFALPLVFICVLYSLTLHHLFDDSIPKDENVKSMETMSTKKRAAVMIGVVILVFALCWLPNMVMLLLKAFKPGSHNGNIYYVVFIATRCLAYFNSCLNPIIYALLSPTFRSGFHNILCCASRRNSTSRTGNRNTESYEL